MRKLPIRSQMTSKQVLILIDQSYRRIETREDVSFLLMPDGSNQGSKTGFYLQFTGQESETNEDTRKLNFLNLP